MIRVKVWSLGPPPGGRRGPNDHRDPVREASHELEVEVPPALVAALAAYPTVGELEAELARARTRIGDLEMHVTRAEAEIARTAGELDASRDLHFSAMARLGRVASIVSQLANVAVQHGPSPSRPATIFERAVEAALTNLSTVTGE